MNPQLEIEDRKLQLEGWTHCWEWFLRLWLNPVISILSSEIWTTLCEVINKIYTCFAASLAHDKRVQEWLCGDGNGEDRWKTLSEDTHKPVTDQTLQRNCPKMQILAPFRLCEFLHSWLRYTAVNGIILRVFRQSMQRCLNLVSKWREFMRKARNWFYDCALGQDRKNLKIIPL